MIRALPERCWLLFVDHLNGDEDEWHGSGRDGGRIFEAVALLWANAPDAWSPVPLPELADSPCLLLSCSGCGVPLGAGEGEHFGSVVEALDAAAEAGWSGQWCPGCREIRWPGFGDFVVGPAPLL